ncbi:phosphoesterase PA-phosphatase [Actinoplanes sp. NEAU-A12]|uniref:Phosphoesterase PA-phosphatase n=1 Tax=Actinoplanes sandaracinus TaxID=3045177 RepID=A0ABT6WYE6_9ACTN|nr:phosphatase PAP2 family protein [Actinoplanes sandaracinus]MDI6104757.1 phosphoesterase PA-phosphatase [Actinoplanes sandaracinus]
MATSSIDRVTPADRVARLLTEILSPAVLVATVLFAVAWASADSPVSALVMGVIAAAAASFLPIAYILHGVRRGAWTDRHVGVRDQRTLPMLVCLGSTASGTLALAAAGAPRDLLALIGCMAAALVVAIPITLFARWKISIHSLVAAGTAVTFTVVFGWALLFTWPLAAAVGWSRVRLGDHTTAQVLAGALVGACATGLLYPALR